MEITVIYTLTIFVVGLLINNHNQLQQRNYIIFSGLILILVSGLRSIYIGTDDTYLYSVSFFNNLRHTPSEILVTVEKDPFFYAFTRFVGMLVNNDYQWVLLTYAICFSTAICYLIYKESPIPMVSFIVLISLGFFFFSMNGIRQTMAMSFVVLSYFPLKNRKLLWFITIIAIASLFHKTALIFLLAYPFSRKKLNKKTIILYTAITILCFIKGNDILLGFVEKSVNYDTRFGYYPSLESGLTISGFVQLLILFVFTFCFYKRLLSKDKNAIILYNLLILSLIFQSMAIYIGEMFRIAMYFSIFLVILIPKVLVTMPRQNRLFYQYTLCILLLIYFFFMGNGTVPYRFYFQN